MAGTIKTVEYDVYRSGVLVAHHKHRIWVGSGSGNEVSVSKPNYYTLEEFKNEYLGGNVDFFTKNNNETTPYETLRALFGASGAIVTNTYFTNGDILKFDDTHSLRVALNTSTGQCVLW